MEWKLCALAHRANEQKDASHGNQRPCVAGNDFYRISGQRRGLLENLGVIQSAEVHQHQGDPEKKAEVTDTVYHECLEVGVNSRRSRIPEPDQQVGD